MPPFADRPPADGGSMLVYVLVVLLLFLVGREIVCWYFKLNEIASLLRQVRDRLWSIQAHGIGAEAAAKGPPKPPEALAGRVESGLDKLRAEWRQQPGVLIGVFVLLAFIVAVLVGISRWTSS